MAKKTKIKEKKVKKEKEIKKEEESGTDLDDAFADDEDVEYAESKPFKPKKKKDEGGEEGMSADELEEELDEIEEIVGENGTDRGNIQINASKPITKIKKGDKIKVDGKEYEVDSHYVLIDHGTTKEMAIEIFSGDKDYQIRYFNDQAEATIDFYELQGEIMFVKKPFKRIEW